MKSPPHGKSVDTIVTGYIEGGKYVGRDAGVRCKMRKESPAMFVLQRLVRLQRKIAKPPVAPAASSNRLVFRT